MKIIYSLVLFLGVVVFPVNAQESSAYFPQEIGFTWHYKVNTLDSLNNPVDSLEAVRIDSFATVENYEGKLSNIVITKEGVPGLIQFLSYSDSLIYHFSGDTAEEYSKLGAIKSLIVIIDSTIADSNFSFLDLILSLEGWYSVYQFNANVNETANLISIDTTINFNSTNLPLHFEFDVTRLNDENLNTEIGSFSCKKFVFERGISYVFSLPPLPPILIPIASVYDTVWIAPSNWIVKEITPSTTINLAIVEEGIYTIPGMKTEIINDITVVESNTNIVNDFVLMQNYPNPFNPSTKIRYSISNVESSSLTGTNGLKLVQLKIYNILGKEVATLVNEEKPAGTFEVEFFVNGGYSSDGDVSILPSGVYFYQLKVGSLVQTRKMILLK